MEAFFQQLPIYVNVLLVVGALYTVTRASHYLVDGAVYIAHEFEISPLIIGATIVAMGTSSCELAVNLVVVLGKGDTSVVVGNILGSNLVNFGIELGISALIAGVIAIPRNAFEKDIPLYLATTGLLTIFAFNGQIDRLESILMLFVFLTIVVLIVQYARARQRGSVLLIETTEIEEISHPTALQMSRSQALLAAFGGLAVLVLASRVLIANTAALAEAMHVPEFIIGLAIIGPGTSLPEIASSIQAARRGSAGIVLGTAFGSNTFNLLFGLGLPAMLRPLAVEETALQSFVFMNVLNLTLLTLILLGGPGLGKARTMNRTVGGYLVATYLGFIAFQISNAAGGTTQRGLQIGVLVALACTLLLATQHWVRSYASRKEIRAGEKQQVRILCATRGGQTSRGTHEQAIALAQERGAELIFLYVFDRCSLQRVATPIVINVEAQIEQMQAFLETTARFQAQQAGVASRVVVRSGNLREELQTVAWDERVNLIVLGSPTGESSTFVQEALYTLAQDIEQSTDIPVTILGQPAPDECE